MNSADILKIKKGDVVSFVGSGGKTSLISSIARELSHDFSVVVTTTTKVYPLDTDYFDNIIGPFKNYFASEAINKATGKIPAIYSALEGHSKCLPLSEYDLRSLADDFDVVLIEADGSRGKSLKRPRTDEPAVPDISNKVVWCVGADVLGHTFDHDLVFKPKFFKAVGLQGDDEINFHSLRTALYADGGYLDKLPGKEIFLLLNKIDLINNSDLDSARLLQHNRLSGLILSGLDGETRFYKQLSNRNTDVTSIILAAGSANRFGSQKLLAEFKSKPLICQAVDSSIESNVDNTIAVIPENSPDLRNVIEKCGAVEIIENPEAEDGMSSSILAGLNHVITKQGGGGVGWAVMFILGDMPNVDSGLINDVIATFKNSCAPICATYQNDRFGHPVIFHPVMFNEIGKITGDTGCREILKRDPDMVRVVTPEKMGTQHDIDTPSDLERINLIEDFYKAFRVAYDEGRQFAVATVVKVHASTPREPGAKMGIMPDGTIFGTIGGGKLEELVKADALDVIRSKKSVLKNYVLTPTNGGGIGTECGGDTDIFIEPVGFGAKLLIFGAGHISQALYKMALVLGMAVEIIDERPEYARSDKFPGAIVRCCEISDLVADEIITPETCAIIVTHGHLNDTEALKFMLGRGAAYIGMIGSKRKIKVVFDSLIKEGTDPEELECVYAPIGLDIGAESPGEIAVAILAEIISIQRTGMSNASMRGAPNEK